jgi:hypothetical protein
MKRFFPFLLLGLFLAACTEISYKEPQPKGVKPLSRVPAKLHGQYLIHEDNDVTDTLTVSQTGYLLGDDDHAVLSDSLVLKYYKGYYFLNSRSDFAWYVRIIRLQKNKDLLYLEMEGIPEKEEERQKFLEKLSADIPVVETIVEGKTYYVIEPSPKELMGLIKKGYFKERVFTRIP